MDYDNLPTGSPFVKSGPNPRAVLGIKGHPPRPLASSAEGYAPLTGTVQPSTPLVPRVDQIAHELGAVRDATGQLVSELQERVSRLEAALGLP